MKRITRPAGLREIAEVLDISDVQKVVCMVAYHTSSFRVLPNAELEGEVGSISKWGEVVSASFDRVIIGG